MKGKKITVITGCDTGIGRHLGEISVKKIIDYHYKKSLSMNYGENF